MDKRISSRAIIIENDQLLAFSEEKLKTVLPKNITLSPVED